MADVALLPYYSELLNKLDDEAGQLADNPNASKNKKILVNK